MKVLHISRDHFNGEKFAQTIARNPNVFQESTNGTHRSFAGTSRFHIMIGWLCGRVSINKACTESKGHPHFTLEDPGGPYHFEIQRLIFSSYGRQYLFVCERLGQSSRDRYVIRWWYGQEDTPLTKPDPTSWRRGDDHMEVWLCVNDYYISSQIMVQMKGKRAYNASVVGIPPYQILRTLFNAQYILHLPPQPVATYFWTWFIMLKETSITGQRIRGRH